MTALSLAAMMTASLGLSAFAQGEGDYLTGTWTDTSYEKRTMPDGSETERETSAGSICITADNNNFGSIDQTFLKSYTDRQCSISGEEFSSVNESMTTMDAKLACGPLTGNLRVHSFSNRVDASTSFEIETPDGPMTVFTRSEWTRAEPSC